MWFDSYKKKFVEILAKIFCDENIFFYQNKIASTNPTMWQENMGCRFTF